MYRKNEQIVNIPHLGGGINDRDQASEIADFELVDARNIEVDSRSLKTAAGWVDYGSKGSAANYWGIFQAEFENGTNKIIRQEDGKLQYDNGGGVWTDCTGASGLTEEPCSFVMLNNTILWSNGTDSVLSSTDGITWTTQASLPKARQLFHNGLNRVLFVGQPDAPSRVDWSDINDPLTVQASAYQFIGKNDGEEVINAIRTEKGGLYIFKTYSVYYISDVSFDMIATDPIGRLPYIPNTAVATNNSVMCAGLDGIYEIIGGTIAKVSNKINAINFAISNNTKSCAVYFDNTYRVSLPTTNQYNDLEYVVNRDAMTGDPSNPYAITRNTRAYGCYGVEKAVVSSTLRHRLYFGASDDSGNFGYINVNHDQGVTQGLNGSAQECYFITKFYNNTVEYFIKRFRKYYINVATNENTTLTIHYRFGESSPWNQTNLDLTVDDIDIAYGDGDSGEFDEGYSFQGFGTDYDFIDLESGNDLRGIQFKVEISAIKDVEVLSQAYQFVIKPNMH